MNKVVSFAHKHQSFFIILGFIIAINLALLSNDNEIVLAIVLAIVAFALILSLVIDKEIFFYITAFFIPLSFIVNESAEISVIFPSELLAVMLLCSLALSFLAKGRLDATVFKHPLTILILLNLGWMLVASSASSMPFVSYKKLLIKLLYSGIYFFFSIQVFKKPENIAKVYIMYILGMIYPIVSAFIFHYKYDFSTAASHTMTLPFYHDHTIYGACLAFLLPVICFCLAKATKPLKYFWVVMLGMFSIAVLLSYSRASWLSLGVAFLVYLIIHFRIKMRFVLLFTMMLSITGYLSYGWVKVKLESNKSISNKDVVQHAASIGNINTDVSNKERLNRWYCAWNMFLDRPVFGFGPGTYQFKYGSYQVRRYTTRISTFKGDKGGAHSDYLGYLSETGLIGLLIYLGMAYLCLKTAFKQVYDRTNEHKNMSLALLLSLTTFFIHGFLNSFTDIDKSMMLVFCAMAGLVAIDLDSRKNKEIVDNKNDVVISTEKIKVIHTIYTFKRQ